MLRFRRLLREAETLYNTDLKTVDINKVADIFEKGGYWMAVMLQKIRPKERVLQEPEIDFIRYGILKYSLALTAFVLAAVCLFYRCWPLLPLSVLAFYAVEVLFLFLFPLLIDRQPKPLQISIRLTLRTGYFSALRDVFCIGMYMCAGLLSRQNRLKKWYTGCIAILIWYVEKTGNR